MKISDNGIQLIEVEEGFVPYRYDDGFGNQTIGFGTTNYSGIINPLPASCTRSQAEVWLVEYLERDIYGAMEATGFRFNQNQWDACCDCGYNCGPSIFTENFELGRALRSRDVPAASEGFLQLDTANGIVVPALVRRRWADKELFDKPVVWGPPHVDDPYLLHRFMDHNWKSPFGHLNERREVQRYNGARLKPEKYEHYLKHDLQPRMRWLADRLAWIVKHERHGDWTSYWSGWRYQQLIGRAQGEKFPKTPK